MIVCFTIFKQYIFTVRIETCFRESRLHATYDRLRLRLKLKF